MTDISVFLAQFWGWYIVIFCSLLIVRPKRMAQLLTFVEDEKHLVLTSLLAIIIGLLNILIHNIWEANWKLIITLIGWAFLLEGIVRFSFPRTSLKTLNALNVKMTPYILVALFIIGFFLLNKAYLIVPY
ncbi:hypothetical protein [Lutibacter citreus]|uniref:hypothetical protein n=1 Tax=Lutibacter citreus TaxID=2138210 RepID=UPI000DBE1B4A|nr:hypothetical protein [Lutibacter citreus]